MCKIPLRSFPNAVIEHDLVTIRLRMDWVEKDGTDPSILIYITSKCKKYSAIYSKTFIVYFGEDPTNGCYPRNQSSVMLNSVHHQYQHQDKLSSTHHQQQQQYYHSSAVGGYDPTNVTTINTAGDHKDISSMTTTTTVVYNSTRQQPQPQQQQQQQQTPASLLAIEQIASYLKAPFLSSLPSQTPIDPPNTALSEMIHNPMNNTNDLQSNSDIFELK
jgi:hypothetical protein